MLEQIRIQKSLTFLLKSYIYITIRTGGAMKHRTVLSEKERKARSKATQLIHDKTLIIGGLVEIANTCGKPNCKCTRGEKHKSWCVSLRHKGKRKMIHIPRVCEKEVFEGVKAYQLLWEQMEIISDATLERILSSRKSKE
jgi:hypothetical protein